MSSGRGLPSSPGFRGATSGVHGGNTRRPSGSSSSNVQQRSFEAPSARLGGAGDRLQAAVKMQQAHDEKAKEYLKIEAEKKRKKDEAKWARHSFLNTDPGYKLGSSAQGCDSAMEACSHAKIDKQLQEVRLSQKKKYDHSKQTSTM